MYKRSIGIKILVYLTFFNDATNNVFFSEIINEHKHMVL